MAMLMCAKRLMQMVVTAALATALSVTASWADIERFVGSFKGTAQIVNSDGSSSPRNMSVDIEEAREGFSVAWTSGTRRADGSLNT